MGFSFFHEITVLLPSRQALSDACSPCSSSVVISSSGCHLSIYICTTLNGSLFRGCVPWNSAFTTSFVKVFCRPAGASLKKCFFGIVLHLAPARFIWWPKFLYWKRESTSWCLSLSPADSLWCPMLQLPPSRSPYPTYFSFNLGWRDPTYSVIACRNCCTHSVDLGALLWSCRICCPHVFWDAGAQLHAVFKVWV